MVQFKFLFVFEAENEAIVEVKRTDIQSNDPSVLYQWLLLTTKPDSPSVCKLSFVSMWNKNDSENDRQSRDGKEIFFTSEREFSEGFFQFSSERGSFFHANGNTPIQFTNITKEFLQRPEEDKFKSQITNMISQSWP
jgi:hypothetical protein